MPYDPKRIEPRWQRYWEEQATFKADVDLARPKFYVLDMFPYPSGAGLHVGHPEGYTATDIVARYKRMRGFNVLHPMGWDAFGLPAEHYAVRTGVHPAITTTNEHRHTSAARSSARLLLRLEPRESTPPIPDYFRWTQWIFLKLFERGLAYQAEVPVNWCPAQGTVLANEEVKDGKTSRPASPSCAGSCASGCCASRPTPTAAGRSGRARLARGHQGDAAQLDRPSEGAEVDFAIAGSRRDSAVFTTRPDTLFGATYMVLSPEHPLVAAHDARPARRGRGLSRRGEAAQRLERTERSQRPASSPALRDQPGQRQADPDLDRRLRADGLRHRRHHGGARRTTARLRVRPRSSACRSSRWSTRRRASISRRSAWDGDGTIVNSGALDGLDARRRRRRLLSPGSRRGWARPRHYRLRDWLFSRQRYWGEPFPILHRADGAIVPLPEDALPVLPPEVDDYKPTGDGRAAAGEGRRLGAHDRSATACRPCARPTPCRNGRARAGTTCAFSIRRTSSARSTREVEKYWMPVDLYVGGAEHAVLHLLYARFWHKVLLRHRRGHDEGAVPEAGQPGHDPRLLLPGQRRQILPPRRSRRARRHGLPADDRRERSRSRRCRSRDSTSSTPTR